MVVIWGNSTLIARATRMVWTCSPSSGAIPGGNANWNCWAVVGGALAASSSLSAAVAMCGAPAGTTPCLCGVLGGADGWAIGVAVGVGTQHRCSVLWAWNMAAEIAIVAPNASQRPRPFANRFLRTNSTLMSCPARCSNFAMAVAEGGRPASLNRYPSVGETSYFVGTFAAICCATLTAGPVAGNALGTAGSNFQTSARIRKPKASGRVNGATLAKIGSEFVEIALSAVVGRKSRP